jgi:hypothetical protein
MGKIHYICSMDYKRIYDNLMESRLLLKEERIKLKRSRKGYFEAHHIVPKSMGGEGQTNGYRSLIHPNIIMLTAREHYIAHALLFLIHKNRKMSAAFLAMCTFLKKDQSQKLCIKDKNFKMSSRLYEEARLYYNKIGPSKETREKKRQKMLGRKVSQETIEKLRQANLGKKHSLETKEKLRQINLGKTYSEETREKKRQAMLGRIVSQETREKLRQINLGNKHCLGRIVSSETRRKIGINSGNARRGMKQTPEHIRNVKESIKRNRELGLIKKHVVSSETREKLRQAHLGKKHSEETCEKRRQAMLGKYLGRKLSPETIAKLKESRRINFLLKCEEMEKMGYVRTKSKKWVLKSQYNNGKRSPESIAKSTAKALETRKKNQALGKYVKRQLSPETKAKISKSNLGRKVSSETREKIRQSNSRRVQSPESIAKRLETIKKNQALGKYAKRQHSQETREKLRQAHLGKKLSPEAKEKLRQARLGKKLSPESIAKREETKKRNRLLKLAQQQETQNN